MQSNGFEGNKSRFNYSELNFKRKVRYTNQKLNKQNFEIHFEISKCFLAHES